MTLLSERIFHGDDGDWNFIETLKKSGTYAFASCYDITWGFILPCRSGVIWEQQTDGCCCHHVYIEGILIPLRRVVDISKQPFEELVSQLSDLNYKGKSTKELWARIWSCSHIKVKPIDPPRGMPGNQEAFQWIKYLGHEEGYGSSMCLEGWKNTPIVLVYPNSD